MSKQQIFNEKLINDKLSNGYMELNWPFSNLSYNFGN